MSGRPTGREKHVAGGGSGVHLGGSAGGGPVGGGRPPGGGSGGSGGGGGGMNRGLLGGGGGAIVVIIIIIVVVMRSCSGGGSGSLFSSSGSGSNYSNYMENLSGSATSSWDDGSSNTGSLDETVVSGAREKYTKLAGDGSDVTTVMVYMCGTDLESRSGMATKDLQEMINGQPGDKLNLIVYTGGCKRWQNNVISSSKNQIYQVKKVNGETGLIRLEASAKGGAMTDPATLSYFIKWGKKNFPADRYELILWDHGCGSKSGYGYDETQMRQDSMDLAEINAALKDAGVKFDFIGFDACLMATTEMGLVASQYADYMIASEETEPGVGWYYTDWIRELSQNPSVPALQLGKTIIDSYTRACQSSCPGQSTTLSITDLAELQATVPSKLNAFATSTSKMITGDEYKTVSASRSGAREFAPSNRLDQVDLVHLAKLMNTKEGNALADALLGAVKYNRTSSRMTNAYGLSIYFPYKAMSSVDQVTRTYKEIGMDEEYTRCIKQFASMGTAGQSVFGGTNSPMSDIFGQLSGSSLSGSTIGTGSSGGGSYSQDTISQLLESLLGGRTGINGLDRSNTEYLSELDVDQAAEYLANNQFDTGNLTWTQNKNGDTVISMPEAQWDLVQNLDLNMFYDNGSGYVDLGFDNVFDFDDSGNLLAATDKTWVSIDNQIVAYYRLSMTQNGNAYQITGRVPAELNGNRINLILVFDSSHPDGYVAGACYNYVEGETDTVAKNLTELKKGDKLKFVCDFYDYNGNYQDTYYLGNEMKITKDMEQMVIRNQSVGSGSVLTSYCFTDLYGESYWTPALNN